MGCCSGNDGKFVITRGVNNSFIFTIKANGSTLPIEIDPSDTFTGILRDRDTDDVVLTKPLMVESALNGRVRLELAAAETETLTRDRGGKEDRYYLRPVYTLTLDCVTAANGEFLARIESVYVN